MNRPIQLIIVEDQVLLRQALLNSLKTRMGLTVVGEFGSLEAATANFDAFSKAEVGLIDIRLGTEKSFELVRQIRTKERSVQLIWMTGLDEDYLIEQAFGANLPGFVHKEDPLDILVAAIEVVSTGGRYYSQSILRRRTQGRANANHYSRILSPREQEILSYIGAGFNNEETAALLGLSDGTIQAHRRNIMSKVDVHSASELLAYALRCGFADVQTLKKPVKKK